MDLSIPADVTELLASIDAFIDRELVPIQDANPDLFDHRREFTRTDVERGGIPTERWRDVLAQARRLAIDAGLYQYPFPVELGGSDGSNLAMAIIREHLAHRGPGLHAELTHEASVVANEPLVLVLHEYGTRRAEAPLPRAARRRAHRHRVRADRARSRQRRHVAGDDGAPGRRRRKLGPGRRQALHHRDRRRRRRARLRPHLGPRRQGAGDLCLPGGRRHPRPGCPLLPLVVQHAHRPRRGHPQRGPRRETTRSSARSTAAWTARSFRAREPHPPGGLVAGRRPVLHRPQHRLRA